MYGPDQFPLEEIEAAIAEWTQTHDPLARNEFNTIKSRFMREVGEPARVNVEGVARLKNTHMRVASAREFGVFAFEEDPVLIELDDESACGEMFGYPVDGGWVPVLFCLAGPPSKAKDRMEQLFTALQGTVEGDLALFGSSSSFSTRRSTNATTRSNESAIVASEVTILNQEAANVRI